MPELLESFAALSTSQLYRYAWNPLVKVVDQVLTDPIFLGAIVLVAALEWFRPAKPHQKVFGPGVVQDFVWVFFAAVTKTIFLAGYIKLMQRFHRNHLDFLTIESVRDLPVWGRVVWGIVLLDFLRWVQHYLNHKVPWLWQFHAVHHSQRGINFFSDFRGHAFEHFTRQTVCVIPMLMLSVDLPKIAFVSILLRSHACLYHGNIRANFGFLGRFFVSPQSHRVHHSTDPEHRERNFGALLTIWDRIFGTQHPDRDAYPDTGIPDSAFPKDRRGIGVVWTPFEQFAYPFRVIAADVREALTALRARASGAIANATGD